MKLTVIDSKGYCSKCDAQLIETPTELYCPNRRWWNSGHYRGVGDGCGVGSYVTCGARDITVPDAPDSTWLSVLNGPTVAGNYETLNSVTGRRATLFRSLQSGGWWFGTSMCPEMVTHWRTAST